MNRTQRAAGDVVPKPDLLVNDDGRWWIPCADAPTAAKAKSALYTEVTYWNDWRDLRCRKVWLCWDANEPDPMVGIPGAWISTHKTNPYAVSFYMVWDVNSPFGKMVKRGDYA